MDGLADGRTLLDLGNASESIFIIRSNFSNHQNRLKKLDGTRQNLPYKVVSSCKTSF